MVNKPSLFWHDAEIDQSRRAAMKHQRPCVLWFTGLSGAGKSSIANAVDKLLHQQQIHTYLLDGDNVRQGLCQDLGFSDADRAENIRRVGEVARLMKDAGLIVLAAFISPHRLHRDKLRKRFDDGEFIEIYIDTPLEVCESRDPKGLYQRARQGLLDQFTGVDSDYEPPLNADLILNGATLTAEEAAAQVIAYLQTHHYLKEQESDG